MNPKERAKELVDKYINLFYHPTEQYLDTQEAKQCALIALNEILFSNNTIFETNIPHECWKYWIEVKQEIEKL